MPFEPDGVKVRAGRNRTLTLNAAETAACAAKLLRPDGTPLAAEAVADQVICGDMMQVVPLLPEKFADLLLLDPPYNLAKEFGGVKFAKRGCAAYLDYLESWFPPLLSRLKEHASLYLCGDWHSSAAQYLLLEKFGLKIRNRIVWQREKGRGAARNWKNGCEEIWFATLDDDYYFDADAVRLKRRVLAPYRENGQPKDWVESADGRFRLSAPSNFWDDLSVPYWSMPENTDHPTQKPEKLLAKLILASSAPGAMVLDPFLGSGTTAVVARKLGRRFCGIERCEQYGVWSVARLERAAANPAIQGYADGVFWERNTAAAQKRVRRSH